MGPDHLLYPRSRTYHPCCRSNRPRCRTSSSHHLRRQGKRPRHFASVEEDRYRAHGERVPTTQAGAPARRLGRYDHGGQPEEAERCCLDREHVWRHVSGFLRILRVQSDDSLSDESSVIPGSLGLLPSASLAGAPDPKKTVSGIYEP